MGCLGANLVFEPPAWPVLLSAAAAAVLCWEVLTLWGALRADRGFPGALALAAGALLAGPPLALALILVRALPRAPVQDERGRRLLQTCLHGSLLATLGVLTVSWHPGGALVAIVATAGLWAVRSYRRTTSPVRSPVRALLLGLRLAVILLLGLWGLQPALEYHRDEYLRSTLLFALDASASMQRRDVPAARAAARTDEPEPQARIDAVRQALKNQDAVLADLADQADVELFTFAGSAAPTLAYPSPAAARMVSSLSADGPATAIGDSVAAAYYAAAFGDGIAGRRNVAGIVLLTDGCNNTSETLSPEKLAALMGSRSTPLYAVGVGSETATASTRTLNVKDLAAPDEVEAFNRLSVAARVESVGLAGRTIAVTCRFGETVVGVERFVPMGTEDARTSRFSHVPLASGFQRLTVSAECEGPPVRGLAGQGSAGKLIHVVDREMRILYVEGTFRYESKYIARALSAGRRFSLDRRILLGAPGAQEAPPLSDRLEDWLGYHAVIFGDVPASLFTSRQIEIVRDLVGTYGKGFCMLGGRDSFGAGGWADTPLADVLPVDPRDSTRQTDAPLKVRPTPEGLAAEMLRIGEDADTAAAWAKLPPVAGANVLGGVKPGATVLAIGRGGEPLIVSQPYGAGRSLAVAFDTTWRWVLTPQDTAEMQQRFWRQAVMFLAAPKGNVWIVTDKTTYDTRRLAEGREAVEITAGVEDTRGRPLPEAPVTVTLKPPGDGPEQTVPLRAEGSMRRGRLAALTVPGVYELRISASVNGKPIVAHHRFEVVHVDLESRQAMANFALLREMAAASEGQFVTLNGLGDLLKKLRVDVRPVRRDVVSYEELGRALRWPATVALIALLCLEWALRKRRGLV